jgi:hypothetical protein
MGVGPGSGGGAEARPNLPAAAKVLEVVDSGPRGLKRKSSEGPQHPITRKARTGDSSDSEESEDYPHLWPDFNWERPVSFVPSTKLICPLCNFRTLLLILLIIEII